MQMQHRRRVGARLMDRRMDGETRRVDGGRRVIDPVSVDVDLDEAGRRDLLEHMGIGVDQEMMIGPRHARRQMGEDQIRSEEHTSELQSLMRISYAVFCLTKKKQNKP